MDIWPERVQRIRSETVPVPWLLQREFDNRTTTSPRLMAKFLTERCGAPHLDYEDWQVQDVLCPLAEPISRARREALPDPSAFEKAADAAVDAVADAHLISTLISFGQDKLAIRSEVRFLQRELRAELLRTVVHLMQRAAKAPPPRRTRRPAA